MARKRLIGEGPNPSGLCQCGCGGLAPVSRQGDSARGFVKDKPLRFIKGHEHLTSPVPYVVDESGCWIWQRATNASGYGITSRGLAHRSYYEDSVGPIPEGMQLDHLCSVRRCVNPAHLEPVSNAENSRRGKKAILCAEDVAHIRSLGGNMRQVDIASRFGISQTHVSEILCGKQWKMQESGD